jgi:dTDP-4-dehydrorhamnose reductase
MKVLLLGGSGMLGHRLWINLRKEHEVWVTVRGNGSEFPSIPEFPQEFVRPGVDALNFDQVTRALASIQPDIVINCIGLIKQQGHLAKDPLFSISINSMFPHKLSLICRTAKIRLVHISTDCVFSGKKGNYTEEDQSDAEDLYGRTKFLGEVTYPHCVTIRTSIIGRELKTNLGLIEWFLSQSGRIQGYKNAIYTGFSTDELSRIIMKYILPNPDINGLYQVSSDPISKYDLLQIANNAFHKNLEIAANEAFLCDRSLNSSKFKAKTGYQPPSWDEMIHEMADTSTFYEKLKK